MRKFVAFVLLAATAATPLVAQEPGPRDPDREEWRQNRQERRDNRAEVRQDRAEVRGDRAEVRQDRAEVRGDVARGNVAEARRDQAETGRDRRDLRADQRDFRADRRDARQDRALVQAPQFRSGQDRVVNPDGPDRYRGDRPELPGGGYRGPNDRGPGAGDRRDFRDDRRDLRDERRDGRDDRRDWRDDRGGRYEGYNGYNGSWNNGWRNDRRYNWQGYRTQNRAIYRLPRYVAPRGLGYGQQYRRWAPGYRFDQFLFAENYWIADPWRYRLPPAYGPYRWVRYYDDVVLVDIRTGLIADIIYSFFW